MSMRRVVVLATCLALMSGTTACSSTLPTLSSSPTGSPTPAATASPVPASPAATGIRHSSYAPIEVGAPIDLESLSGRIVFDDFEDVYAMDIDGSNRVTIADAPGPEFDGTWSTDGLWVAYRDSTQGNNVQDEIYIAAADGSEHRNLTNNPANDWGPDWSHDGATIAFNSTRDGMPMSGYLVNPDGSNLRRIEADVWIEYPSFSPDDSKLAFMGAVGSDYSIYVIDLVTNEVTQLTDSVGEEGWPAWSPDGTTIAFSTQVDSCTYAARDQECWDTGDIGPHFDIWLIGADGSNLRRVTPEFGQFVTWSPDGRYLLISGASLYVVRPDGTGRREISPRSGGLPDWRLTVRRLPAG